MFRSIFSALAVFLTVDAGLVLAHLGFRKNSEFFCVAVAAGKASVVRGRVPIEFLADIKRAARSEPSTKGFVRATPGLEGSVLQFRGLSSSSQQRLRNSFRTYPVSVLRQAPPIKKKSFGQHVGLVPLAWLHLARRAEKQHNLSIVDADPIDMPSDLSSDLPSDLPSDQ